MALRSTLLANQLLAGLQQVDPHIHDLFRAIISDLNNLTAQVDDNTEQITLITGGGGGGTSTGLTHGQVMKRIAGAT